MSTLDTLDLAIAPSFKDELVGMLREYSDNRPRSRQTRIGPSEIGHPCDRRMAMRLAGVEGIKSGGDPLPSTIGSWAHAGMEEMLTGYNKRHGERFLIEQKVYPLHPAPAYGGTMDCYDLRNDAVIDWKFAGAAKMTAVRRDSHPGEVYRIQSHIYGLGCERTLGLSPKTVHVAFWPRAGFSTGAVDWSEPYDRDLAIRAIERLDSLLIMADDLKVEQHPDRFAVFPIEPLQCEYCPFFSPSPTSPTECGGPPAAQIRKFDGTVIRPTTE